MPKFKSALVIVATLLLLLYATEGQAGWLDKLSDAVQKLKPKDNKAPPADPDHPLTLSGQGHCHGQNSATCLDYMEVMDQCIAPIRGYRMQMLAQRIAYKLKHEKLSASQRQILQQDMTAAQLAAKHHSDTPTIAGEKNSQRYLSDISEDDQIWINAEFGRFHNRIMNKCEGADHMGVGHRTEFMTDFGPTGDQAIAAYHKAHPVAKKSAANTCLNSLGGLRFSIMADMMEKKMHSLKLNSTQQAQWQQDIAAVRKAAKEGGTKMPKVDDPTNPYRPITRLSSQTEQYALNDEYMKQTKLGMAHCQSLAHNH